LTLWTWLIEATTSSKAQEVYLQFVLGTVVAGSFVAYLQSRKEKRAKREAIHASIRNLIQQVDELYRSSKQVKRAIRSRIRETNGEWRVAAPYFQDRMDELSRIQLSLEQCWQSIRTRDDLFLSDRCERIHREIEYAETYLHAVVEEFEKREVVLEAGEYVISEDRVMLRDFLGTRWLPKELEPLFEKMEKGTTATARYNAWTQVVAEARRMNTSAANTAKRQRRYKSVSDECLLLVLREMREAIEEIQTGSLRGVPLPGTGTIGS